MSDMIKLPEGMKVEINRKVWRGEIPAAICPDEAFKNNLKAKAEKVFKKLADAEKAKNKPVTQGKTETSTKPQAKQGGAAE